jgi:Polyketide cyclase / dehydrase and lipid transport
MTTAYYSTVLDHPVETVWSLIRDFNNCPVYIDGVTESIIEDDKRGDEVGAVRRFLYGGSWTRQRLAGHSDVRHSLTYAGLDPLRFPDGRLAETISPARYEGTMHLLPIVDGTRTFIEWSVTLDARPEQADSWRDLLLSLIPRWTDPLRNTLARPPVQDC